MAGKPISSQRIPRTPQKQADDGRPRPGTKVEEASREAASGVDRAAAGTGTGTAGAAAGSGDPVADFRGGGTASAGPATTVEDRNERTAKTTDPEAIIAEARAEAAAARSGRGDALAESVGAGAARDGGAPANDGSTGIAEQGTDAISAGGRKGGAAKESERLFKEELDKMESERLFQEDLDTPELAPLEPELAPLEPEPAPPPDPTPTGGKKGTTIPDEERFDPDSRGGQIAEALRASTAPRGGGGDGRTDPVDNGGVATVGGGSVPPPDTQGTLLGGDTRGAVDTGGAGGAVPNRDAGRIDPAEGDDVGGGQGREDDPFSNGPDPTRSFDFRTPDSDDGADEQPGEFVLVEQPVLAATHAVQGLSPASDEETDPD